MQRPALDAAARQVAGAEHDVGAVARGVDQAREVGRVVGEVGVHLDDRGRRRPRARRRSRRGRRRRGRPCAAGGGRGRRRARGRAGRRARRSRPASASSTTSTVPSTGGSQLASAARASVDDGREVLAFVVGGEDDPGAGHRLAPLGRDWCGGRSGGRARGRPRGSGRGARARWRRRGRGPSGLGRCQPTIHVGRRGDARRWRRRAIAPGCARTSRLQAYGYGLGRPV